MKDIDYACLAFTSIGFASGIITATVIKPSWAVVIALTIICAVLYFFFLFKAWQKIDAKIAKLRKELESQGGV